MKAAVIGYGKSGRGAEKILRIKGFTEIDIYDDGNPDALKTADFKDIYDCAAVSPGIDLKKMPNRPAEFTSEIELAHSIRPEGAPVVAVTGTNGKSTVTSLIAQLMNRVELKATACGNIGMTYAEAVTEGSFDSFAVELSSFQTGMLHDFSADCAVITNLAEDHMDRYTSLEDYAADKMNLLKFIKPGGRLIIEDEPNLAAKTAGFEGEIIKVDPNLKRMPNLTEGRMSFGRFYLDTDIFPLSGRHNLMNLTFALFAVDAVVPLEGNLTQMLRGLKGLEHRCEHAGVIKGVEYINDSKGTNVHSTLTALKGFDPGVVVILGGKDKNGDFTVLKDVLNEKSAGVIAYGEAGLKIYESLRGMLNVPLYKAADLKEAVKIGYETAVEGQKVVLSPACASFDEHQNFEHRGRHFKELVEQIRVGA